MEKKRPIEINKELTMNYVKYKLIITLQSEIFQWSS